MTALAVFLLGVALEHLAAVTWRSDTVHWWRCEHDASRTTAEIWGRRGIHRPHRIVWTPKQHREPCRPKLIVRARAVDPAHSQRGREVDRVAWSGDRATHLAA